MGAKQTRPSPITLQEPIPYTSAGCVFTDGKLFLAGYQPNKKRPCISGLGGSKKKGEIAQETAIRETLEELFHLKKLPKKLTDKLIQMVPEKTCQNGSYFMYIYSFNQLEDMLRLCAAYDLVSPLYSTMPTSLIDLLLHRTHNKKAEVSHLCLLPLVKHNLEYPFIYLGLFRDITTILL
jgi:hypothetical protein